MSSSARDAAPGSNQGTSGAVQQTQPLPAGQRRSSRASSTAASAALASAFADPAISALESIPRRGAVKKQARRAAVRPKARSGEQTVVGALAEASDIAANGAGDSTVDNFASRSGIRRIGGAGESGSVQGDFRTLAELAPVPERDEWDTLTQVAMAALAAQDQESRDIGAGEVLREEPIPEVPPPVSAKARGKRKAVAGGGLEATSKKRKSTVRRSRSVSVAETASVDGAEEAVKPKVKRERKPLKKITKKSVRRPELPALFKIDNPNDEVLKEREKELQRGMHPELARKMGVSLEKQSTIYKTSYAALEQELIRIQIEESVLRNVKKVVRDERDKLRYAQGAG